MSFLKKISLQICISKLSENLKISNTHVQTTSVSLFCFGSYLQPQFCLQKAIFWRILMQRIF